MQFLVLHSSRRYVISSWSLFNSDCDEPTEDVSFAVFFITNSCSIINHLKAVISVLSTNTFSSNEVILSSSNEISFSDICFSMILTSEDVLQLNGDDISEILDWMGPFRNVWSLIK